MSSEHSKDYLMLSQPWAYSLTRNKLPHAALLYICRSLKIIIKSKLYYKLINSEPLVCVLNIATVALYPKNQPFAVPGLSTIVLPTDIFSNLCV